MTVRPTHPNAVQIIRSNVIENSLVIRGPKLKVELTLLRLEEGLGYQPPRMAETQLSGECSVQLNLHPDDWGRVPALNAI